MYEKEVFGGSIVNDSKKRRERPIAESKEFELKNRKSQINQDQDQRSKQKVQTLGGNRNQGLPIDGMSVEKFFEKESEIDDFDFE